MLVQKIFIFPNQPINLTTFQTECTYLLTIQWNSCQILMNFREQHGEFGAIYPDMRR